MKITLSHEQFVALLQLAYLGDWMANAIREPGEEVTDLSHMERHLFSLARDMKLHDVVDLDDPGSEPIPSQALEDRMYVYIDEYDDETFWIQLVDRLADRDLLEACGEPAVRAMSADELSRKREPYIAHYEQEVADYGIDRLRIVR